MNNLRKKGKTALSSIFKNKKNITTFEKNIWEYCERISPPDEENEELENIYLNALYECINIYKRDKNAKNLLEIIKNDKLGWEHSYFENIRQKQEEVDNFILNPFVVEEGVLVCKKCNSNKTVSFSKQLRSGDESATVFAQCVNCENKWVI